MGSPTRSRTTLTKRVCVMSTSTHSQAAEFVRSPFHTYEALVTDAFEVVWATAHLVLHLGALKAAATYIHHRPSRAAKIF